MIVKKIITVHVNESEIKEAILSLLYKQKPSLRPSNIDARLVDPVVDFIINKNGVEAKIEINPTSVCDDIC